MMTEDAPAYKAPCKVDGCQSLVGRKGAKGLCNAHYKRSRKGRDLSTPVQIRGNGSISSHGYRYISRRAEHRIVVENAIGRALQYNEVVHHKDGNPLNNSLDNLEVMERGDHARSHTKGKTNEQRKLEKEKHGYCLAGKP